MQNITMWLVRPQPAADGYHRNFQVVAAPDAVNAAKAAAAYLKGSGESLGQVYEAIPQRTEPGHVYTVSIVKERVDRGLGAASSSASVGALRSIFDWEKKVTVNL